MEPKRGDIASSGARSKGEPPMVYIKRIIGLPGDTVQMRAGRLYINGKEMARRYVDTRATTEWGRTFEASEYEETLPDGVSISFASSVTIIPMTTPCVFHRAPRPFLHDGRQSGQFQRQPRAGRLRLRALRRPDRQGRASAGCPSPIATRSRRRTACSGCRFIEWDVFCDETIPHDRRRRRCARSRLRPGLCDGRAARVQKQVELDDAWMNEAIAGQPPRPMSPSRTSAGKPDTGCSS